MSPGVAHVERQPMSLAQVEALCISVALWAVLLCAVWLACRALRAVGLLGR